MIDKKRYSTDLKILLSFYFMLIFIYMSFLIIVEEAPNYIYMGVGGAIFTIMFVIAINTINQWNSE